jgi:hypothetical protein
MFLVVVAAAAAGAAHAIDGFSAAVESILTSQTDGVISTLEEGKKRALIACVNDVLANMPNGMQRFVLEAADADEMEDRFGQVVHANRAEWQQKIAQRCSQFAM